MEHQPTLFSNLATNRNIFWGINLNDFYSVRPDTIKSFIIKAIVSPSPAINFKFILDVLCRLEQGEISEQYLEKEIIYKIRLNPSVTESDIRNAKHKIREWEYHYGQLTKRDIEVFSKSYPFFEKIFEDRMDPIQMSTRLKKFVKGQDEALLKFCLDLYQFNFYCDSVLRGDKCMRPVSSSLLLGHTGSGKTYMTKKAAKLIKSKYIYVDCSRITSEGYYGLKITTEILSKTRENESQKTIVFLDEIDKLVIDGLAVKNSVLTEILTLLERKSKSLRGYDSYDKDQLNIKEIDTSLFYYVLAGTFSNKRKEQRKTTIGFKKDGQALNRLDFNSLGLPKELIGRIGSIIEMNPIKKDTLINILKSSEESPLQYYEEFFKRHNRPFQVSNDELEVIADRALEKKTGARALDSVLKDFFNDKILAMFK